MTKHVRICSNCKTFYIFNTVSLARRCKPYCSNCMIKTGKKYRTDLVTMDSRTFSDFINDVRYNIMSEYKKREEVPTKDDEEEINFCEHSFID